MSNRHSKWLHEQAESFRRGLCIPEAKQCDEAADALDELEDNLRWAVDLHNQIEEAGIVHYDPNMPEHIRSIVKARKALAKLEDEW